MDYYINLNEKIQHYSGRFWQHGLYIWTHIKNVQYLKSDQTDRAREHERFSNTHFQTETHTRALTQRIKARLAY